MPQTGVYAVGGVRASVSPYTYNKADFDTIDFSSNTRDFNSSRGYEQAYEIDIEDGIGEWFGRGNSANPLQAQGFAGLRLVSGSASSQAAGTFRIAVRNAQGRRLYNVVEGDLSTYDLFDSSGNELDRKNRQPLPNSVGAFETEPHKVSIDLDVDSDITIDDTESQTEWNVEGYRAESLE
jgi:hypothetical protein